MCVFSIPKCSKIILTTRAGARVESTSPYFRIKSGDFEIGKGGLRGQSVFFDLSAISRSLFDRSLFHQVELQDLTLFKEMEFSVYMNGILIHSDSIKVIWGALQIGETYTQTKKLKMFKGYPFTVPLFLTEGGMLQIQKDGGAFADLIEVSPGKLNVDIGDMDASSLIRLLIDSGENNSTFDITFDFTFRGVGVNSIMIDVELEDTCGESGPYLRWINKCGEYNYWLFRSSLYSATTSNIDIVFDGVYRTTNFTNKYHSGLGQSVGKNITQERKLFAPLVDSITFDFLENLAESPVIDEFVGYDAEGSPLWVSVTVATGTVNKTNNHLQDFELSLIPNPKLTQSL